MHLGTKMVTVLSLACVLPLGGVDAQALPGTQLREYCVAYRNNPRSAAGQFCVAYVRGFLDAATGASPETRSDGEATRESWTQRAWRTRVGAVRRNDMHGCLSTVVTPDQVITELLAQSTLNAGYRDTEAPRLLMHALRRLNAC